MVFEMSWIKHRSRNSLVGNVIHILRKSQISPIKGPKATNRRRLKVTDLLFNCYFLLFKPFYLVAATTGGLLVGLCVYFEIGNLAFASWSIPIDHSDLK